MAKNEISRGRLFRRPIVIVVGSILVIFLAATAWVGFRGFIAKTELERAIPLAADIRSSIVAGNSAAARTSSIELDAHARKATALTSDPIWRAYETIPLIGPNLTAFREVSQVVRDVNADAVAPLTSVAASLTLSEFKPVNGSFALQPLIDAEPRIAPADRALQRAKQRVHAIDTAHVLGPVRDATEQLATAVDKAADSIDSVERAAKLLPVMLGSAGPRNYLLLFQNNAEVRATGGLPGALALIATNGGHVQLAQQATGSSFQVFTSPVLNLPTETRGIFSDRLSTFIGDVTLTPNFPTSATIAREMWRRVNGTEVDGVISIDPIALSYLLRATGPITLPSGDVLTSQNAVKLLLTDTYARFSNPDAQHAFFASAASAVFTSLSSGKVDPGALVSALAEAGQEHRILVWSAHPADQAILTGTTLTGELPTTDASATRYGVYLNDATGAKMDTYLTLKTRVGSASCRADGRANESVSVTLTNTAPLDAATSLPSSITGGGLYGVPAGTIKTLLLVYAPKGAANLSVSRNGKSIAYQPATDTGYPVSQVAVELAPGASMTTQFNFIGPSAAHGPLTAVSTPVIAPNTVGKLDVTCGAGLYSE